MPTFIDESGDTGPVAAGGRPYFRMAAVWTRDYQQAQTIRDAIHRVRSRFHLAEDHEFKFEATHKDPRLRTAFFEAALQTGFRFAFSSIDKRLPEHIGATTAELHWDCAVDLAVAFRSVYREAELHKGSSLREQVIVDDNRDKKYLSSIKKQFSSILSPGPARRRFVHKVFFRDSKHDSMIQLADMVCGAMGEQADGKASNWAYTIKGSRVQ